MSVQTQIDRISGAVSAALAALAEKGVTVPAGTKVDGLAALIAAIEAGGGSGGNVYVGTITLAEEKNTVYVEHMLGVQPKFAAYCAVFGETHSQVKDEAVAGFAYETEELTVQHVIRTYSATSKTRLAWNFNDDIKMSDIMAGSNYAISYADTTRIRLVCGNYGLCPGVIYHIIVAG